MIEVIKFDSASGYNKKFYEMKTIFPHKRKLNKFNRKNTEINEKAIKKIKSKTPTKDKIL